MAHHNTNDDEAEDYVAAFARLPEVLQSAVLGLVRAARTLTDEQAVVTRDRLNALVEAESPPDAAGEIVTAAAMVVEAHYDELRADNP